MTVPRLALSAMAFVALCATLTAAASASTSASGRAQGAATFSDPAGDAQGGPDVTRVAINGDAASGSLAFTVSAGGLDAPASEGIDREVWVWLDTDSNSSTGDPDDGTEYALGAWHDSSGKWWNFARWNGAAWEAAPRSPTIRVTGLTDTVTWALSTADIGGVTSFRLYVVAGNWNASSERYDTRDDAPDTGWWTYDIAAPTSPPATPPAEPKVNLLVSALSSTPKTPVAGKPFAVRFLVQFHRLETMTVIDLESGETRQDLVATWTPVPRGKTTCAATVAGKVLARCGPLKGGDVRVSLVVPKTAAGKALKITVRITATDKATGKTVTATKVATFRVK